MTSMKYAKNIAFKPEMLQKAFVLLEFYHRILIIKDKMFTFYSHYV